MQAYEYEGLQNANLFITGVTSINEQQFSIEKSFSEIFVMNQNRRRGHVTVKRLTNKSFM